MLRVIRRLLTVIIWAVALFLAVAFFVVAPDASGNGPLVVRILAIGILLVAYVLNKIVNWVFADTE